MGPLSKYPLTNPGRGCGQKGAVLGRLAKMAFPVLPGFHLVYERRTGSHALDVLASIKQELPFPWIIRSSSPVEDTAEASFAGLFESSGAIYSLTDALDFIDKNFKIPEAAYVYGQRMGVEVVPPSFLVQPFVEFISTGVFFSPDPLTMKGFRLEFGPPGMVSSEGRLSSNPDHHPGESNVTMLSLYAKKIREAFGWKVVDIEFGVMSGGSLVLLQARPVRELREELPVLMTRGEWHRDLAHNPLPLSPLHESLVGYIADTYFPGLAVWNSYLYESKTVPLTTIATPVEQLFTEAMGAETLKERLDAFARFTAGYCARSAPATGSVENSTVSNILLLTTSKVVGMVQGMERERTRAVRSVLEMLLDYIGVLPLYWDIASPVYGDREDLIRLFIEKVLAGELAPMGSVASPGEQDDLLFARALAHLRDSVREIGERMARLGHLKGSDEIFFLTINELLGGPEAHCFKVPSRRKEMTRMARLRVPRSFADGRPVYPSGPTGASALKGESHVPGRVSGVVRHLHSLAAAPAGPFIAVAHALTPQDILLLDDVVGIILESPSHLGHGAIIASELRVPTVVGVSNALELLPSGTTVDLFADTGEVVPRS